MNYILVNSENKVILSMHSDDPDSIIIQCGYDLYSVKEEPIFVTDGNCVYYYGEINNLYLVK